MARAFILVMDSLGIGASPDAHRFGDTGADTLGHIADECARGAAEKQGVRSGRLNLPNLTGFGLGQAALLATGRVPKGLEAAAVGGQWGAAQEVSLGKDTPSGHWEMAGVAIRYEWTYFPKTVPTFPVELTDALALRCVLPGFLGNCHASGTDIIRELGMEHLKSGKPIIYTSADSVFQIAAHEREFGLERLYTVCEAARELLDPHNVGRVIARPFVGDAAQNFKRTGNRRDYSVPPPAPTLLERAEIAGREVISVGKIGDIFAHVGTGKILKGDGHEALWAATTTGAQSLADGGLLVSNFVDFDQLYGHRRDVCGYAAALEEFDRQLPVFLDGLKPGDLVVITADHGCDPTWPGSDHTREYVPVLALGPAAQHGSIGIRETFADIAATIDQHLQLPPGPEGKSWLC